MTSHLLVIGGRSGAGKSSAAFALHDLLAAQRVRHAVVEGDALDLAWPAPWEHRLAERNLAAIWANYRDLGYDRLVYTNTVAVLHADQLAAAMGDDPEVTSVLLTADDTSVGVRLARREQGTSLDAHLARSASAAATLDASASPSVHRLRTDGLAPEDVAAALRDLWLARG